ncbi:MAG TPA: hypothetical protein VGI90_16575 [Steroidobacteraceae bacterium]|jgi:hypothetical protein
MMRSILGVVVGVAFWMLGFYALASGLAQLWPDYAIHARQWVKEGVFTFTPLMACCNLVFWILGELGAGWITAKISRRRVAVWTLAGLLGIYLATLHWVMYWPRFPWWYNLAVVISVVPAVLLGTRLANLSGTKSLASAV